MKKLNSKAIVASGTEMSNADLCVKNNDETVILWILWNWDPNSNKEHFAPVTEIFFYRQRTSTHKIAGEELYMTLPKRGESGFAFSSFINKHVEIEEL